MRTCPACAATSPSTASWCTQCFAALVEPAAGPAHGTPSPTPVTAPDRFGIMRTLAPVAATPAHTWPPATTDAAGPSGTVTGPAGWPAVPAQPRPWVPTPTPAGAPTASGAGHSGRRLLDTTATALVAVSIGVGALGMGLSWLLGRRDGIEPEAYLRYAIVITLAVYTVVATLLVTRVLPHVRLRWHTGSPAVSVALGLGAGATTSLVLLGAVSAAAGHLSPDPRVVLMMSEGDLPHIAAAFLISCVAAPLVEETLFRGVLLESLRGRGIGAAVWLSALGFAVWHLTPSALRYYALMGAAFGWLYVRRGLLGSMSAHVAFNGVLSIAALTVVLAPAHAVTTGELVLQVPGGWSQVGSTQTPFGAALALRGPSGAELGVLSIPTPTRPDAAAVLDRVTSGAVAAPGATVDTSTARVVKLPTGDAVEVDVTAEGHRGSIIVLPHAGSSYEIVFAGGGSIKARSDLDRMLRTVRWGAGA